MDSLKTGTILHGKSYDYKIIRTLGQGTFGITYLASVKMTGALGSIDSEVLVAVKEFFMRDFNGRNESSVTYSSKDGAFAYYKSKFIHEAENLSNLHDSRIIKVIELFEENHTAYYVMEYVSQGSLDNHIKSRGHLSSKESVDYAIQIAKALGYMHQNKMLHLDLKPSNIMMRKDNKLVLIDFGLSKRFDVYASTTIGHGTPGYAPVEQANYQGNDNGEFPVTMDIYALGCTMFKMLTGHRPPEASVILNEGFPIAEFKDIGVNKPLVDIVARCMEPRRKNRYKTTFEVIDALYKLGITSDEDTNIPKGYYKIKTGDREYGTFKIETVPVTTSFEFPEYVSFKLWDNSKQGKSYEVIMTNGHFEDGYYSLMRIWDKGIIVDEHEFQHGIPNDVKDYLISHGFLSTEHWENECETSPINYDFGTDASITMIQRNGNRFVRRVGHAHASYHNLLLDELIELLNSTSLAKEMKFDKNKRIHTEKLVVPFDTYEISVNYKPCQIGSWKGEGGFVYSITEHSLCTCHNSTVLLDYKTFQSLLTEIGELGIYVGVYKKDTHDYSEIPGKIDIKFNSREKGSIHLSLIAFNTDMQGGNIYGSNIIDLAESIHRIILKYLPDSHEPTRELIYSIPESTSEIWINYSEGGIVGLNNASARIRLGKTKKSAIASENKYTYSAKEFKEVIEGLRKLELRSQDRSFEEPSTGVMFPSLTIELYDNDGKQIKKFYAQNYGDRMIGDIALPVDDLKNELIGISPSFKKALTDSKATKTEPKKHSWLAAIFFSLLVSAVVGIIALPSYFFLNPSDTFFNWLWITAGITELSGLLFTVFAIKDETRLRKSISMASFFMGIVALVAYVVLWIIQMCKWWA